jgi:hypothetical protein
MPRFAVLEHDHPTTHWDLLLQTGAVLRAWRLAAPPADAAEIPAEAAFDHRPLYLDYEGTVSGSRGRVTRWDGGEMTWEENAADRVRVRLLGGRLRGVLRLECDAGGKWRAEFAADAE